MSIQAPTAAAVLHDQAHAAGHIFMSTLGVLYGYRLHGVVPSIDGPYTDESALSDVRTAIRIMRDRLTTLLGETEETRP